MGIVAKLYTKEILRRTSMNEFHCLKCGHVIKTEMERYNEKCPICAHPIVIKKVGRK